MKLYCLINTGTAMDEEIANAIFDAAQEVLRSKKLRTKRITLPSRELTGEIQTAFKLGTLGTTVGFVFRASLDWDQGSCKTEFIVRQLENPELRQYGT